MEEQMLDELDYKILNLIANDTRISFLEVSRICDVSGGSVHQRFQKMINNRIIVGSEFKLNLPIIGYATCAYLMLRFEAVANIDAVIAALSKVHEIVECHRIIGEYDVMIKAYAFDNSQLMNMIQKRIKPLGLVRIDALFSCEESFRKQILFDEKQR